MDFRYSIPRPTYPTAIYLLLAAVALGLIGLGLVAFGVFAMVDIWPVALAFALVIEFGMISEAVSIIRKNRPAIVGLVISILVSGGYNYTKVEQAAAMLATPIQGWQILALAIGPLSAVFFLALSLGTELREHEQRVAAWTQKRQSWLDEQARLARLAEIEEQQRRASAALEVERLRLDADRLRAADLQNAQLAQLEVQLAEQRRAARAAARRDARANHASRASVVQPALDERATVQLAQNGRAIAQPAARATYDQFKLAQQARNGAGPMGRDEIVQAFSVSPRTAYNWLAIYKKSNEGDSYAV